MGLMDKTHCDRCGKELNSSIVSKMNTDVLCTDCKLQERDHQFYKIADAVEVAFCKQGNYNYPGLFEGLKYPFEGETAESVYERASKLCKTRIQPFDECSCGQKGFSIEIIAIQPITPDYFYEDNKERQQCVVACPTVERYLQQITIKRWY